MQYKIFGLLICLLAACRLSLPAKGETLHNRIGVGSSAGISENPQPSKGTSMDLAVGDGSDWSFVGGRWTENPEGVISPPDAPNLHSRAFYVAKAFGDVSVEFDYNPNYRETGHGMAGLVLRARGPNEFYLVYFPWSGMQLRAKHYWVAVAKIQGDGYIRNIKMAWVPGVASETGRWFRVRTEAKGSAISVFVDGHRAITVTDETFRSGCVGLAGYGWYHFRNIRVSGTEVRPPSWKATGETPVHSFTVGLDSQYMPTGCVAPNGDILLAAGSKKVRSTDKGRTWEAPADLPAALGSLTDYGNSMFRTAKGRLIVMVYRTQDQVKKRISEILISESKDSGETWSEPAASQVAGPWPDWPTNLIPYGPLVETEDGTLLRFLYGGDPEWEKILTWSATHNKAFAIRSTDGGKNWSAPIEIDQVVWPGKPRGSVPGSLDLTESTGVAVGNRVMVLIRPIYSLTMWQCWSNDAGVSWDAAVRTTFPGYAQSLVRTASGAIVCAHRYPQYSINVSRDDGLNWDEGTILDYPVWAMGNIVEVEPDVVLCTYMNASRDKPLLAQLIRVTRSGIEPIKKGN